MAISGPVDPSVLTLQATHRSLAVWGGSTTQLVDDRVLEVVKLVGFSYNHRLLGGGLELDRALITALVKRWRLETHTFHLMVGEATNTLQDVAIILGLPIEGQAVIGHGEGHWPALVHELLGVWPENPQDPT
ncbi:protein MAIN-LIKE 1-like [Amaranthus tricolor]|uniref:protein MAIN-LIKE 1-like n=1 Tax=Amaranthus tricolor TaxID=29722 RepID=UPI00258E4515|nr:protein MAIN-LIKE 1-like [Amaranthus tricolor]